MKNPKLAVGYVRSASNEQNKGKKNKQMAEIKRYAAKKGYLIAYTYRDEGHSGLDLMRPALNQMCLDSQKSNWSTVIVTKRDRLSRKLSNCKAIEDVLRTAGVTLISVS